jgi:hypothetical protein
MMLKELVPITSGPNHERIAAAFVAVKDEEQYVTLGTSTGPIEVRFTRLERSCDEAVIVWDFLAIALPYQRLEGCYRTDMKDSYILPS